MVIYSCKGCVAPKRHPGCHDHCAEYLAQKSQHDAQKAAEDKRRYIEYGLNSQCAKGVYAAMRICRKKG